MRKVICYVNVTLDGFLAGPGGELDWMIPDPDLNLRLSDDLRAETDTILIGRRVYEAFEANFQHEATDPASPPELVDFATWMLETPKVVFSRQLSTLDNPRATPARGALADTVAAAKREPGKAMVVFGGVSTVRQLVRHGLVDEYWLKVYPVALGSGQAMFTDVADRVRLRLVDSRAGSSGIVAQRYTI